MICYFCKKDTGEPLLKFSYISCQTCKAMFRSDGDYQTFMVNERLESAQKTDRLSRILLKAIKKTGQDDKWGLVDFGCGGGKFLSTARPYFKRIAGIEITPESIQSATAAGIEILSGIPEKDYEVLTFWHSLEHLPLKTLEEVFTKVKNSEIQLVHMSVPNAESITLRFFGEYDAFYDRENHTMILSQSAVKALFASIGFKELKSHRIFAYSIFGAIQGSINITTRTKNQIYTRLKRGGTSQDVKLLRHLLCSPVFALLSLVCLTLSLANKRFDTVINKTYVRSI